MRREIIGIFLFFFVIFTLISLLSYSPTDPSIHSAGAGGRVHNLFGMVGAHLAGLLIGLFGMGAFWVPLLLLLGSLQFFGGPSVRALTCIAAGGILLVLTTAGLLAIHQDHYVLFEKKFSSGGLLGIPIKAFLIRYTNPAGTMVILGVLWLVGFILATGFSLLAFCARCGAVLGALVLLGIQLFLGIIGGLTLMIGGVGVANIMYATVKERTREIGVRMALGARPGWVTGPLLLEGVAYTLVGGLLGLLGAVVVVGLLGVLPTEGNEALEPPGNPTRSLRVGAAPAALLGFIGLAAAYFPARRAAAVDPAETLRYE